MLKRAKTFIIISFNRVKCNIPCGSSNRTPYERTAVRVVVVRSDYQDFELPKSDFSNLVIKILQYSGVSIREADIIQAAKSEELQDAQQKQ